ncbi:MAG: hypothetical protein P4L99_21790 [Chthoniobacter sp.]|nr:hypothetical protein [Chthoniobacter sp.]
MKTTDLEESLLRAHRALAYGLATSAENLIDTRYGLYPVGERRHVVRAHKRMRQHVHIWLSPDERKAVRGMAAKRLQETLDFNRARRRENARIAMEIEQEAA